MLLLNATVQLCNKIAVEADCKHIHIYTVWGGIRFSFAIKLLLRLIVNTL